MRGEGEKDVPRLRSFVETAACRSPSVAYDNAPDGSADRRNTNARQAMKRGAAAAYRSSRVVSVSKHADRRPPMLCATHQQQRAKKRQGPEQRRQYAAGSRQADLREAANAGGGFSGTYSWICVQHTAHAAHAARRAADNEHQPSRSTRVARAAKGIAALTRPCDRPGQRRTRSAPSGETAADPADADMPASQQRNPDGWKPLERWQGERDRPREW